MDSRVQNIFYTHFGEAEEKKKKKNRNTEIYARTLSALFNFLDHSHYRIKQSFCRLIDIDEKNDQIRCIYDGKPMVLPRDAKPVVLIIYPSEEGKWDESKTPFGWIMGRQAVVYVEARGEKELDERDRTRLVEKLSIDGDQPPRFVFISWDKIHGWVRKATEEKEIDESSIFLAGQFYDYLEINCLAPFAGFDDSDFLYFFHADTDVNRVTYKLKKLAKTIGGMNFENPLCKYEVKVVGREKEKRESLWISLTHPEIEVKDGKIKVTHLQLNLCSEGLGVFILANGEKQVKGFLKGILLDKKGFFDAVQRLRKNYFLLFREKPLEDVTPLQLMHGNMSLFETRSITKEDVKYIVKKMGEGSVGEIRAGLFLPRHELCAKKENIINDLQEIIADLHGLMEFANWQNKKMKRLVKKFLRSGSLETTRIKKLNPVLTRKYLKVKNHQEKSKASDNYKQDWTEDEFAAEELATNDFFVQSDKDKVFVPFTGEEKKIRRFKELNGRER